MFSYDTLALAFNVIGVIYLIGLSILLFSIRGKLCTSVTFAIPIILTTIPIYIYNIFFLLHNLDSARWIAPFAYTAGTTFLPLFWLLIHKYLNPQLDFKYIRTIHFIPSLVSFFIFIAYILSLSYTEQINFMLDRAAYMSAFIKFFNIAIIISQALLYYTIITVYMIQYKKATRNLFSKSEWIQTKWVSKTLIIISLFYTISLICHQLMKCNNTWIFIIIDIIVITIFILQIVKPRDNNIFYIVTNTDEQFDTVIMNYSLLSEEESKRISMLTLDYIKRSKNYLNHELSINDVADEIGEDADFISIAISSCYNCSFYDFINKIRVENIMSELKADNHNEQNIDSIISKNGFSSKQAFIQAFKLHTGKYLSNWLQEVAHENTQNNPT